MHNSYKRKADYADHIFQQKLISNRKHGVYAKLAGQIYTNIVVSTKISTIILCLK